MYYVLFTWIKGRKERDFQGFKTKLELRDFLGKNFEKIMVWNIHKAEKEYRFGLYELESEPEEEGGAFLNDPTPESDEEKPEDYLGSTTHPPAIKKENLIALKEMREKRSKLDSPRSLKEAVKVIEEKKHPYLKDRKEEPSAMEKIADDIEKEQKEEAVAGPIAEQGLTEAEILKKNKTALKHAENAMEAAKKEQNGSKKTWRICTKCNINRISPVNKSGICTACQLKRKTNRPYVRRAQS